MIHHYNHEALVVLVLFTVSFYHFLFSRYLELAERHFSSDILVPFPDSGVLYSRVKCGWVGQALMTINFMMKSHVKLSSHSSQETML